MAGTIAADTLTHSTAGSIATNYVVNGSAKAWVNGAGTTSPASIRDSFNASSISDNGTGAYALNWTNSFSNTTYSHSGSDYYYGLLNSSPHSLTTSAGNVDTYNLSGTSRDNDFATSEHGDLA